jgi:hypothetical protein
VWLAAVLVLDQLERKVGDARAREGRVDGVEDPGASKRDPEKVEEEFEEEVDVASSDPVPRVDCTWPVIDLITWLLELLDTLLVVKLVVGVMLITPPPSPLPELGDTDGLVPNDKCVDCIEKLGFPAGVVSGGVGSPIGIEACTEVEAGLGTVLDPTTEIETAGEV